jgi:hypothetical protein
MDKGFGTLVDVSRQSPREGGLGKPHLPGAFERIQRLTEGGGAGQVIKYHALE